MKNTQKNKISLPFYKFFRIWNLHRYLFVVSNEPDFIQTRIRFGIRFRFGIKAGLGFQWDSWGKKEGVWDWIWGNKHATMCHLSYLCDGLVYLLIIMFNIFSQYFYY